MVNMLIYFLLFLFSLSPVQSSSLSARTLPYIGDISLVEYLQQTAKLLNIFIIGNFIFDETVSLTHKEKMVTSALHFRLINNYPNINHKYLHSINSSQLLDNLPHYRLLITDVLLIFDFQNPTHHNLKLDQSNFNLLFSKLNRLYLNCRQCQPFIVLFSETYSSVTTIYTLATKANVLLKKIFRAVLVVEKDPDKNNKHFTAILVHPVLYGCAQVPEVRMAPETAADWAPYQIRDPKRCTLGGQTLNVSISHVSKLFQFYFLIIFFSN